MIDYLLMGVKVAVIGGLLILMLRGAPAKWRLRVALGTLVLALLPWHLLPAIQVEVAAPALAGIAVALPAVEIPDVAAADTAASFSWWLLPGLGGLAALYVLVRQHRLLALRRLNARRSAAGEWLVPGSMQAAATWFGRPEIWIGADLLASPRLDTVLQHERMHVQLWHPHMACVLTVLRCVFWWHPVVWLLVWVARREMEFECDEACASALGRSRYRADLAELVRDMAPGSVGSPGFGMARSASLNMRRLRALGREVRADRRHGFAAVLALVLVCYTVLPVRAAQSGSAVVVEEEQSWRVEINNVGFLQAMRSIAGIVGGTFYVYPDQEYAQVHWTHPQATADGILKGFLADQGLAYRQVGSRVFVAPPGVLDEATWYSRAHVIKPFSRPVAGTREGGSEDGAVFLRLKLREAVTQDDVYRSEVSLLVSPDQLAGVRWDNRHIEMLPGRRTADGVRVEVTVFEVDPEGRMAPMHSGVLQLQPGEPGLLEWSAGAAYALEVTASEPEAEVPRAKT